MSLLGDILIGYAALSLPVCGFGIFALWRAAVADRRANQSRVITETPVDVLFAANDHAGGSPWAA